MMQDGLVSYQIMFQEVLDYTIKLTNWSAIIRPFLFLEDLDETVDVVPSAIFSLHSPSLVRLHVPRRPLLWILCVCVRARACVCVCKSFNAQNADALLVFPSPFGPPRGREANSLV